MINNPLATTKIGIGKEAVLKGGRSQRYERRERSEKAGRREKAPKAITTTKLARPGRELNPTPFNSKNGIAPTVLLTGMLAQGRGGSCPCVARRL